jgi:hypothetical protein
MEPEPLTAARLFERYFLPLYPEDAAQDLEHARRTDANPGQNASVLRALDEVGETFVKMAPEAFGGQDLALDWSDASVHRLGAALTRQQRDAWAAAKAPDGAPLLSHVVVHGALYVGGCVVRQHQGTWRVRRPLWESLVRLVSPAGEADLPIFHWWLKSLSDAEVDRTTLADRYRAHVELPRFRPESLVPIVEEERRIPRLAKVRYDTLHKHLRAHLPELQDLGRDFPSPERLAELAFRWLDFTWLGGGKMLLMHGPTAGGVHLLWLDAAGFAKAAYYPADESSTYSVELEGDRLRVVVPFEGVPREHSLLFWGP